MRQILIMNWKNNSIRSCRKLGFSESTIHRALKTLRENDFIIRVGAKKNGHWEVLK